MNAQNSFLQIFLTFLKLGFTAFGGPATIPYIKTEIVSKKKYLSNDDFSTGIALAQLVPGATAMQVAAWCGLCIRGVTGSFVAYLGFSLPAFLMICALSFVYFNFSDINSINSLFAGLNAVVAALVTHAGINFFKLYAKESKSTLLILACAIAFILNGDPVIILILTCLIAVPLFPEVTIPPANSTNIKGLSILKPIMITLGLCLSLTIMFITKNQFFDLAFIMTKVDLFAWGGGYISLPLMLNEVVNNYQIMSQKMFMDGIALGQITPGPIVMTSAFIGYFVASMKGAIVATIFVFAPSFIILNFVACFYDKAQKSLLLHKFLKGSLISLTGLMAAMSIKFIHALGTSPFQIALFIFSFALLRLKISIIKVVPICALISLLLGIFNIG